MQSKSSSRKGCHTLDRKECHSLASGLNLDLKRLPFCRGYNKRYQLPLSPSWKYTEVSTCTTRDRGQCQPTVSGPMSAPLREFQDLVHRQCTRPSPWHARQSAEVRTGRKSGVATVFISSGPPNERLGWLLFYLFIYSEPWHPLKRVISRLLPLSVALLLFLLLQLNTTTLPPSYRVLI